jgi:hypothetical protein
MKKIIFILVLFCGCIKAIHVPQRQKYVVESSSMYITSSVTNYTLICISGCFADQGLEYSFYDSIGKFKTGDTLTLTIKK